jgi:hypothetical protein
MRTIGMRAHPKGVTFAIYDAKSKAVLNVEQIKIPLAFDVPDALKYVRSNILDVIREYEVLKAGIRVQEPFSQLPNPFRTQIEGVLQEAFASSDVSAFFAGPIAVLARMLGVQRDAIKPAIEGKNSFSIENWGMMSGEQREAILYAVGAKDA